MNDAHRLFKRFLKRNAYIVQPTLIDKINGAIRPQAPGHHGNRVDDKTKMIVASLQCLFNLLTLGDVLSRPEPAGDHARTVLPDISKLTDMLQLTASYYDSVLHFKGFS